jgi:hypothetical protein
MKAILAILHLLTSILTLYHFAFILIFLVVDFPAASSYILVA